MNSAVIAPMISTKFSAVSDSSNSGDMRVTMKMPAVTMVAAWISAEIGVGPSIESGSHTVAYATYSTFGGAHVWRSNDAGATWTAIDGVGAGALPDVARL